MTVAASGMIYVCDTGNNAIRMVSPSGVVTTICGSSIGVAGYIDAVGSSALYSQPLNVVESPQDHARGGEGGVIITDYGNNAIRRVALATPTVTPSSSPTPSRTYTMSPSSSVTPTTTTTTTPSPTHTTCPASYYCFSGAPVICPAGSYCPLSSINATVPQRLLLRCWRFKLHALSCGHLHLYKNWLYCLPAMSWWPLLSCWHPLLGSSQLRQRQLLPRWLWCSGAPTPCPFQVPPSGVWGALQVQGPAFLVETARCLNHCFWNFTSGDSMLSKC